MVDRSPPQLVVGEVAVSDLANEIPFDMEYALNEWKQCNVYLFLQYGESDLAESLLDRFDAIDKFASRLILEIANGERDWNVGDPNVNDVVVSARTLRRVWKRFQKSKDLVRYDSRMQEVLDSLLDALESLSKVDSQLSINYIVVFPDGSCHPGNVTISAAPLSGIGAAIRKRSIRDKLYDRAKLYFSHDKEGKDMVGDKTPLENFVYKPLYVSIEPVIWISCLPKPPPALLNEARLEFVNRQGPIQTLLDLYNETLAKKCSSTNSGGDWTFPICVNELGSGKSTFGENFLPAVRSMGGGSDGLKIFPVLRNAEYLSVGCFRTTRPTSKDMISLSYKALIPRIHNPHVLDELPTDSVCAFIEALLLRSENSASKSLFIVFDEIGKPFARSHEDFAETQRSQMEEFKRFLTDSICPLVMTREKVFVLLCGRAPFLDWVGATPDSMLSSVEGGSIVKAKRISLNMIRPSMIADILRKTLFYDNEVAETKPINEFLGLTDDKTISTYSEFLYETTGGHPRTMYEILNYRCTTIVKNKIPLSDRSSFESSDDFLSREALEMIQKTALRFHQSTCILIEKLRRTDCVSNLIDSVSNNGIRFLDLLPALRIGYQRLDHKSVKLTIPRRILLMLEALMSPSNEFLLSVLQIPTHVPIDFPHAFELLVMRGFTEWFPETANFDHKQGIASSFNHFFGDIEWLTDFSDFFCSRNILKFPKVTNQSSNINDTQTIAPARVSKVIKRMIREGSSQNFWLLPAPMSSSPDLIHVSGIGSDTKMIMIAVKNYANSSRMSDCDIRKEILKAEKIVMKNAHCILYIASTQYTGQINSRFKNGSFVFMDDSNKPIRKVIVLDLTTPDNRARFFHVQTTEARRGLETIIGKTKITTIPDMAITPPRIQKKARCIS